MIMRQLPHESLELRKQRSVYEPPSISGGRVFGTSVLNNSLLHVSINCTRRDETL